MTTERLNSVMVLINVHKDMLDELDDATTVDEFVAYNERRKDIFGGGIGLHSFTWCQGVSVLKIHDVMTRHQT